MKDSLCNSVAIHYFQKVMWLLIEPVRFILVHVFDFIFWVNFKNVNSKGYVSIQKQNVPFTEEIA